MQASVCSHALRPFWEELFWAKFSEMLLILAVKTTNSEQLYSFNDYLDGDLLFKVMLIPSPSDKTQKKSLKKHWPFSDTPNDVIKTDLIEWVTAK